MGPTPRDEDFPESTDVVIPLREIKRPEVVRKQLNRRFSVADLGQALREAPFKLM